MKFYLVIAAIVLASTFTFAGTEERPWQEKKIRILSYNIRGLPDWVNIKYDDDRYFDIGQILKQRMQNGEGPDVVLVQESFTKRSLELQEQASYPHATGGPGKSGTDTDGKLYTKLLTAGLYILSRYPILADDKTPFGKRICATWDCFANKGVQVAQIQIPGIPLPLTIFNTHLQASSKFDNVRKKQMKLMTQFAARVRNHASATIYAGDFNSNPSRPSFATWLELSGSTNVGLECQSPESNCVIDNETDPEMVVEDSKDQFFYKNGTEMVVEPIRVARNFHKPYNGRMLSDHLGYEVDFIVRWKNK